MHVTRILYLCKNFQQKEKQNKKTHTIYETLIEGVPRSQELSPQQKKIVVSNKSAIRREVNKIGKENKTMEDYEKTRGGNR